MEGSWTRLLIAMGVFYILSNILFASLYMLEPSAISTLDQDPTSVVTDSGGWIEGFPGIVVRRVSRRGRMKNGIVSPLYEGIRCGLQGGH